MLRKYGNFVTVHVGDITTFKVDAIVNAANTRLYGGGGVDGAIHHAAGPALMAACQKIRESQYPDGVPDGEAVLTLAGNLPVKGIIHTVGPIWYGGEKGEIPALESCYRRCLEITHAEGFTSIAFPAISTGAYGFPKDIAADIVIRVMKELPGLAPQVRAVELVFFTENDAARFVTEADKLWNSE